MIKVYLIILLFLTAHPLLTACSCFVIDNFCEAARFSIQWNSEHTVILRAMVKSEVIVNEWQRDLIFTVQENYYGDYLQDEIYIIDGSGANCTLNLDSYQIGDELVFIAGYYIDDELRYRAKISNCIPPPLRVSENHVSGNIESAHSSTMSLDKFERLNNCISGFDFLLFPNPVDQVLTLKSISPKISLSKLSRLDLIDTYGRKVFEYLITAEDQHEQIISIYVDQLPAGIYHAILIGEDLPQTIRIMVI